MPVSSPRPRPSRLALAAACALTLVLASSAVDSARRALVADEPLRVAPFSADVTPPVGSPIAYTLAERIDDPLAARGVVLLSDEAPVVLCAVDWIGIANGGYDEWRRELADAAGTTPDRVAIHTLHQHDAPRSDFATEALLEKRGIGGKVIDVAFTRDAMARVSEAIRTALRSPRRATHVGTSLARVDKVASNRRLLDADGKVRIMRFSSSKNPAAIAAPEGVIDPFVRLVSFWDGERPIASLTYYATHPQSYYRQGGVSADFVGLARAQRDREKPDVLHVHFTGAGGNVAAGKYNDGSHAVRPVLAARLAEGMRAAWKRIEKVPVSASDVDWRVRKVALPLKESADEARLLEGLDGTNNEVFDRFVAARELVYIRRVRSGHLFDIACLRVGDVRILHTPGELFVEYQIAAQQLRPDGHVCLAAYGDYGPGYIGTEIAYGQGGYETQPSASMSSPRVEGVLLEAFRELLDVAPRPVDAPAPILADHRVEKSAQEYRDTPYLWLGDVSLRAEIDVPARSGHAIEILWGGKDDVREARIVINGHAQTVRAGGHDGFRWVRVPVPKEAGGPRYDIRLVRAYATPAFLSALRLVEAQVTPSAVITAARAREEPIPAPAAIALTTGPSTMPAAFPERTAVWDGGPPPIPDDTPPDRRPIEAAFRAAECNGRRANEQFFRCRRFVDGWLAHSDETTGLIPRNLGRDRDIWNGKDSAADNYPFMVLTAALTDRPLFEGRMLDMLRTETKLTSRVDRLPDTWSFSRQAFRDAEPNLGRLIFNGSEYVKDGLLPLTEWLGPSPWSQRMFGIVDDIWKHAAVDTPYGKIPSTNVEVNGELLQALSRLYWMAGEKHYLEYAERLGDYYLLGDQHPTRDFKSLRLSDHGCEIVSGLCELYATVSVADPPKRAAYRESIHAMCDRILEVGRNEHGMLYTTIDPQTGKHSSGFCDTWGYNYNGLYTVYLVDGTEAYRDAVRHALGNLRDHLIEHHWGSADGYADSIEGAINLLNREPIASAEEWLDSEIRDMWRPQRPDGVVEGWHGDGNSARTAIMYALWKTQGLTIRPWREDVRFGAVRRDGKLYVSLIADEEAWTGRVLFDRPRHREWLRLPLDYPRINQFPEWFTVERDRTYRLRLVAPSSGASDQTGADLLNGISVHIGQGREFRFTVEAFD